MLSKTISPKELHNNLDNVKLGTWSLIDVRSVSEYRAGHIPMAALMPFGHTTKTAQQINPDAMTVLYCRTGNRSGERLRSFPAWVSTMSILWMVGLLIGFLQDFPLKRDVEDQDQKKSAVLLLPLSAW